MTEPFKPQLFTDGPAGTDHPKAHHAHRGYGFILAPSGAVPQAPQRRGRFRMLADFHVGNARLVTGDEVDWSQPPWCDVPPPITMRALDQAGLDLLALTHGEEAYHLLHHNGLKLPQKGFPPSAPGRVQP